MNCADLERYLEAHLDGQLARGRLRALKQHLLVCSDCRLRVHRLQTFERQLQSRFRSMQESLPLWAGLEVDLVGETEPRTPLALPPPPLPSAAPAREASETRIATDGGVEGAERRSLRPLLARYLARFVGLAMLAAAAATVFEIAAGLFGTAPGGARGDLSTGFDPLPEGGFGAIETADPGRLVEWLRASFGRAYPVPPPPRGFELRGARVTSLGGRPVPAVIYGLAGREVVVFVADRGEGASLVQALGSDAYIWWEDDFVFGAVGTVAASDLRRFREVTGTTL